MQKKLTILITILLITLISTLGCTGTKTCEDGTVIDGITTFECPDTNSSNGIVIKSGPDGICEPWETDKYEPACAKPSSPCTWDTVAYDGASHIEEMDTKTRNNAGKNADPNLVWPCPHKGYVECFEKCSGLPKYYCENKFTITLTDSGGNIGRCSILNYGHCTCKENPAYTG